MPSSTRDGVELERHAARLPHRLLDHLGEFVQVHVPGHDVGVGVGDADERLPHIRIGHAARLQQPAMPGAIMAGFDDI